MPKCKSCKHWHVEAQLRYSEGYWYCDYYRDYQFDPSNEACSHYEEKERF